VSGQVGDEGQGSVDAPVVAPDQTTNEVPPQDQDQSAQPPGIVEGRLQIGPISPVQIGPTSPVPPPELCVAQGLVVLLPDQQTEVMRTSLQPDCSYKLTLSPGTYVVSVQPNGLSGGGQLSQTVQLESGELVELNFTISTGVY
jgi:hypothetical protein